MSGRGAAPSAWWKTPCGNFADMRDWACHPARPASNRAQGTAGGLCSKGVANTTTPRPNRPELQRRPGSASGQVTPAAETSSCWRTSAMPSTPSTVTVGNPVDSRRASACIPHLARLHANWSVFSPKVPCGSPGFQAREPLEPAPAAGFPLVPLVPPEKLKSGQNPQFWHRHGLMAKMATYHFFIFQGTKEPCGC